MKCFIYRNLNRKGFVYSFKALEGPHKGRVVAYSEAFEAQDIVFYVSFAGWQRAIRERRRNVHAGIIGNVIGVDKPLHRLANTLETITILPHKRAEYIRYHPFETNGSFVVYNENMRAGRPVQHAESVCVFRNRIQAIGAK